jgi:hypothetical protein
MQGVRKKDEQDEEGAKAEGDAEAQEAGAEDDERPG